MASRTPAPGRRRALWLAVALGALALIAAAALPRPPRPLGALVAGPRPPGVALSLLAVGDTGDRHWLPALREGQLAVARGMVAEDLRRPADALLLLGDNFYPDGLKRDELVERLRENLVWPYCRFVALTGPRAPEVADACTLDAAWRRPIPLYAVLGNHDHKTPESPVLQRRAVVEFVSNWHVPGSPAAVVELPAGVSLVAIDSPSLAPADTGAVVRALRAARGPWRIALAHHPIARLTDGAELSPATQMRSALAEAGVAVQLFLSGHQHNLQVVVAEPPDPPLQVIVGSGSTRKPLEMPFAGRRFGAEETGFARLELTGEGPDARLTATLYATPRYPAEFWRDAEPVTAWSVDVAGRVEPVAPDRAGGGSASGVRR